VVMSAPVASSIVAVNALKSFKVNEGISGWRSMWFLRRFVNVSGLIGVR